MENSRLIPYRKRQLCEVYCENWLVAVGKAPVDAIQLTKNDPEAADRTILMTLK